ncbi:hypothetical protein C5S32_06715, partial [ANME-1 cluster archaeon GoMg1]|nr:hypothetical protein [ANME-1 cluster archaeon GoMg1]NQE05546.1 hypothetical protein [ANME-1 cluster archaeon GoMg1]
MNFNSKRNKTEKLLLWHAQVLFDYKSEVMVINGDS